MAVYESLSIENIEKNVGKLQKKESEIEIQLECVNIHLNAIEELLNRAIGIMENAEQRALANEAHTV